MLSTLPLRLFIKPPYTKNDWCCYATSLTLKKPDFKRFRDTYPGLKDGDQIFVLDTETLEEAFPSPWQKTSAEVKAMSAKAKTELATSVGDNISKEQFESGMPRVFAALQKAWDNAYH